MTKIYTQAELEGMKQKELRAACKDHSITGYSKMTLDAMRAAILAAQNEKGCAEESEVVSSAPCNGAQTNPNDEESNMSEQNEQALAEQAAMEQNGVTEAPAEGEVTLEQALAEEKAAKAAEKEAEKAAKAAEREAARQTKAAEKAKAKEERDAAKAKAKEERDAAKAKAEADREEAKKAKAEEREAAKAAKAAEREANRMPEQNGVRRPKPDTLCGKAWAIFDQLSAERGSWTPVAPALEVAEKDGQNLTNVRCEYARWRKFNGITGRIVDAKAETPAEAPAETPAE